MLSEKSLHMGLEGLGLSKYESRAYTALLSMGTVSASELSYYAEIPRPKVYPTILKLEKKKLVVTSRSKPLTCTAISPEDAFDGIIQDHIHKVNAMNSLVSELKRIGEEGKRSRGSGEGRYFCFSARSVLAGLRESIQRAQSSILVAVDRSGLGLISECRDEMLSIQKKGVSVRVVVPQNAVDSNLLRMIPGEPEIRIADVAQNCIILDGSEMFVADSNTGRGAIFPSDVLVSGQAGMFEQVWGGAADARCLMDMGQDDALDVCRVVRLVRDDALRYLLGSQVLSGPKRGILDMVEADGISMRTRGLKGVVGMIDAALDMTCSGSATLDDDGDTVTIESKAGGYSSMPWVAMLEEYLQSCGRKARVAYKGGPGGERVYIRMR